MNYFAHAMDHLDRPYFAAGTCVPDWLTAIDRRVRVRSRQARPFLDDPDPLAAAVAGGILRHLDDDGRFHQTRAFAELSLELAVRARDVLGHEPGFRPGFLGHLLVELLLDASLAAEEPDRLESLYRTLGRVDGRAVEAAVNRMARRPTDRLAAMISAFCRERILSDYLEDGKLMVRLNQVMRRVKLPQLPQRFAELLPQARQMVDDRKSELLDGTAGRETRPQNQTHRRMRCDSE